MIAAVGFMAGLGVFGAAKAYDENRENGPGDERFLQGNR
jgi:hypothetical protein